MADVSLVWFRDDLRVEDNPALAAAAADGPVACLYVLEETPRLRPIGAAARWWLHHSLTALAADLKARGAALILRRGDPGRIVPEVAQEAGAARVLWNRRYAPGEVAVDTQIKAAITDAGLRAESFNANLLHEPWTVTTGTGQPYRVFTPYWRACRALGEPDAPLAAPLWIDGVRGPLVGDSLDDWALTPTDPDWASEFADAWTPGEAGARRRLDRFLDEGLEGYGDARDVPGRATTSMLSPHLRWGEISPRQIWSALAARVGVEGSQDADKFLAELGWREFSKSTLFHTEDLSGANLKPEFDAFPWRDDPNGFDAWTRGLTGYPLVDAGMRQLWRTGWMHNRVRMVVASFLIKHLLIDWRAGEAWFWDTLVDADAASNPASWQWVAGSGADAAPFFRIFNPTTQAEKFDSAGDYIRTWVSELSALQGKAIHAPWTAPPEQLAAAGVVLGETYPRPIVDHATARERALAAFKSLSAAD